MIDPKFYESIYLIVLTLLTLYLSNKYSTYPETRIGNHSVSNQFSSLLLIGILIVFIGTRPQHPVFTDMSNYINQYNWIQESSVNYDKEVTNIIFDNFFNYIAFHDMGIKFFFFLMSVMYFACIYWSMRRFFPSDTLYGIVIYLSAFSTFSYATNGIKAGVAATIFLVALSYYSNKIICIIFLLLSVGFHHSMILPITAFVICYFYRNPKLYLVIWILSILIAAMHIEYFQHIFASFSDDRGAMYLQPNEYDFNFSNIGFRPDFIIYSAFPIGIGYYCIYKKGYIDKIYNTLYSTYILTNSIWMLCMYAEFTNRIAYLSWLMLPVVLVYPFFDKRFMQRQYPMLNKIAWGQLLFTIFMQAIYYGYIKPQP